MKKLFLFCAVFLVFSAYQNDLAFGQSECPAVLDQPGSCTASLSSGGSHYFYEFRVPQDGDYKFHVSGEGGFSPEWSAGGYGPASATEWHYYKKGVKIKIDIKPWNSGFHTITINFKPNTQAASPKPQPTPKSDKTDSSTKEKGHVRSKPAPETEEANSPQAPEKPQSVQKPSPKPKLGPASVVISLQPEQITVARGMTSQVKVIITNDGKRPITGLRMQVGMIGEVSLRRTNLDGGESFTQTVNLPPAPAGLSGFEIYVSCAEGAYSGRRVFVNGVAGGEGVKPPEAGPAPESIAPDQIHRLLPDEVCTASLVDTKDQRQWGMFTRRYGTSDPRQSILIVINKNYQVQEEVTPAVYERLIEQNRSTMDRQGLKVKRYDHYPIIIEKDQPNYYIAGNFLFSWFVCSIQCTGEYARPECFDAAVSSVLSRLGYISAQNIPAPQSQPAIVTVRSQAEPTKIAIWRLSPKLIELDKTQTKTISITASNYLGLEAQKVEVNVLDVDGKVVGYADMGNIEPYKEKSVEVGLDIRVSQDLKSRSLKVRLSAANADTVSAEIDIKTRRPSSVTISVEPKEVLITRDGPSAEPKIILRNTGDLSAEDLAVQCELAGTKYISAEENRSVDGNDTRTVSLNTCRVVDQYMKENQKIPEKGQVRLILRKRGGGEILGEDFLVFRFSDEFRSKLELRILQENVSYDFSSEYDDELVMEGWSPFRIQWINKGYIPAQDVRLEIWNKIGVVTYIDIPRVCPDGFGAFDCRQDAGLLPECPGGEAFVKLLSAQEGQNEYQIVLLEKGHEISRQKVFLTVKGLGEKLEKTYENKNVDFKGKVRVDNNDYLVYETVVNKNPCMLITDSLGALIKDKNTARRAGYLSMFYQRHLGDLAFKVNQQQQKNIGDFLKLEAAAQVALFFRDAAGVALADVGVMYLTGDTSRLSRTAAKKIAKNALKSAAERIVKNPDNYLRAIAVKMCKDNQSELAELEKELQAAKNKIPTEEKMNAFEEKAAAIYAKIVPSFALIKALDPDADILSQLHSVAGTMKDEVLNIFPGGVGEIRPEEAESLLEKFGGTMDALYSRYKKYADYKQAVQYFRQKMTESLNQQKQLVDEKIQNGQDLTRDYKKFSK